MPASDVSESNSDDKLVLGLRPAKLQKRKCCSINPAISMFQLLSFSFRNQVRFAWLERIKGVSYEIMRVSD